MPDDARALLPLLLGLLGLAACGSPRAEGPAEGAGAPEPAPAAGAAVAADPLAGYDVATSMAGMFTAAWRPAGGKVPENEVFELDLLLFQGAETSAPLAGAEIHVSAWMPDHGHGMNRKPEAREVAPGRYRVRGMLLHMEGAWQLFVDVVAGGVSERAQFELAVR